MSFRKFFWNIKDSFLGTKFLTYAPIQAAIFPVAVVGPAYFLLQAQKGKKISKKNIKILLKFSRKFRQLKCLLWSLWFWCARI